MTYKQYSSDYYQKVWHIHKYGPKQVRRKVRKHFMTPEEFLSIYELYKNVNSNEDYYFLIEIIESSKTFRHYKTNPVRWDYHSYMLLEQAVFELKKDYVTSFVRLPLLLHVLMEWLFLHTVHANSLNSVTFR